MGPRGVPLVVAVGMGGTYVVNDDLWGGAERARVFVGFSSHAARRGLYWTSGEMWWWRYCYRTFVYVLESI